jgi:hypothetical protein
MFIFGENGILKTIQFPKLIVISIDDLMEMLGIMP